MKIPFIGCNFCIHLNNDKKSCPAFPERIPIEIMSGEIAHDQKIPRQTGNAIFKINESMVIMPKEK